MSVIWISGLSASGKTTVGKQVKAKLVEKGINAVHIDGDDLRQILASKWGYSYSDRLELSMIYMNLASYISDGGTTVLTAIASYSKIREWAFQNIPEMHQFFLEVPDSIRRERDLQTKNILQDINLKNTCYDQIEDDRVCVIKNYGDSGVSDSADFIVDKFLSSRSNTVDCGRKQYWEKYYLKSNKNQSPSPFAEMVSGDISKSSRILDFGCGNGRDSSFFSTQGHRVIGIDRAETAISLCKNIDKKGVYYATSELKSLELEHESFDIIYTRFVIHAMLETEEKSFYAAAKDLLIEEGLLYIECRSSYDSLSKKGYVISRSERMTDHYRRFIDSPSICERLRAQGFEVVSLVEGKGMAVYGDEDPVVIRIKAKNTKNK